MTHGIDASLGELIHDGESLPLFENVRVVEDENGLRFHEPSRTLDTTEHGKWAFELYGRRQWLKERDEYGEVRY